MQGIITGIGNEITPEIDAVINDFIVGENTIIKGLDWFGNTLNAGMCQLCGYRGVLEETITTTDKYVYGKFILNFRKDIEDEFYIETSSTAKTTNVNPTSITSAGTYYLLLYTNKTTTLPTYKYPNQANTSDRARDLIAGGTIDSTATTPTEKNPLDEVVVDLHKTQPNRVANTEYVHKQIEEELKVGDSGIIQLSNGATISIQRRAKCCIATLTFPQSITVYRGTLNLGNMPDGYIPSEAVLSSIGVDYYDNLKTGQIKLDNAITLVNIPYSTDNESTDYNRGFVSKGTYKIGYECQ